MFRHFKGSRVALMLPLVVLVGCGPELVSAGGEDELADGRTLVHTYEPFRRPPRIDMILVIDDSPSMGPFTSLWAQNAAAFAAVLEDEARPADVRVAITTTSVPGPTCTGPRARGGAPIVDSCRAHLEDFVGPDEHGELGGGVHDLAELCQDACSLDTIPLVPSPGHDEHDLDTLALRPWIEAPHNPFGGNLDGVEFAEALICAGLQGFAGCTFESPIEAAARMVEHMNDPNHPMSEFRRPDAILSILTIGDEDDCSHPESSATIFDPAGERIFWSDPQATAPTSAACINAGLECDEQSCMLTDHSLDGTPTTDPTSAVLTPTTRLHDALAAAGEFDDPPWVPVISSIGGYTPTGSVYYTAPGPNLSEEEQLQLDGFGVLPGCLAAAPPDEPPLRAGPGGRLAEIGTPTAQYSICEPDWSPALAAFVVTTLPGPPPKCMPFECIANLDPSAPTLVPDCVVEELDHAGTTTALPTCVRDEAGWVIDAQTNDYLLPEGAQSCWVWLTDDDQRTSDPTDDMSVECVHEALPGELKIARRESHYFPYDSVWQLRCRPCDG